MPSSPPSMDFIHSPDLINLKDNDKYRRQIGSKALIMTTTTDKRNYEDARKIALEQKRQRDELACRVESLERTTTKILDILERMEDKLNNSHANQ